MRPTPELVTNRDSCTIQFDATEIGLTDATFDGVVAAFGDGEGFTWIAGGGQEVYKIRRIDRGFCKDEGIPLSVWLIEILDSENELKESYVFDSPSHNINEHSGEPVRHEIVNKTINLVLDLFAEEADLRKTQPYRMLPGGRIIANPWFDPMGDL
jgi:hypothetical protein